LFGRASALAPCKSPAKQPYEKWIIVRNSEELEPFLHRVEATEMWLLSSPPHKANINYYKIITKSFFAKHIKNSFSSTTKATMHE
jgi:hypothetical protein